MLNIQPFDKIFMAFVHVGVKLGEHLLHHLLHSLHGYCLWFFFLFSFAN